MIKSAPAKGWPKGMNNILEEHEIPVDTLRNAVNVDVLDSGNVRRRRGFTQLSASACHSVWSDGVLALMYKEGYLQRLNTDLTTTTLSGAIANRPLSYTKAGGHIFWSNGAQYGRLVNGQPRPWGLESPQRAPTMVATSGALPAGRYQAVSTFVDSWGEESAASRSSAITLAAPGGITITAASAITAEPAGTKLYLTPANGDVFYRVASTQSANVIVGPILDQAIHTQFMSRFIPCDQIEYWRGRIYGASGNVLWYTEPFMYGLSKLSKNFVVFPSEVTMVKAVEGGMYVAADKTYWLAGTGPDDFSPSEILPYGAARGSASNLPGSSDVMWMGHRGIVLGTKGGQVTSVQEPAIAVDEYADAATLLKESNSLRQLLAVGRNPLVNAPLAAADFMDVEVIRHADNQ